MGITAVEMMKAASYGDSPERLDNLSQFNFVYGANGTGKTTVSRVIADESKYDSCSLTWEGGRELETRVYNRDFVEENFGPSSDIKGVFTLGKHSKEVIDEIKAAKKEQSDLENEIAILKKTLQGEDGNSGKKKELSDLEVDFEDKCWLLKQKHDEKLKGAFRGVRDSKKSFRARLLAESSNNKAEAKTLQELEERAETVFEDDPEAESTVPVIASDELIQLESNAILRKKVVGKEDVDIAAMIKKLGNSDWVKQGWELYASNDGICPFCQQETPEGFAVSLNEYFDESFETDMLGIKTLLAEYKLKSGVLQTRLQGIIDAPSRFLEVEKLEAEKRVLDANIRVNVQLIEKKMGESSRVIELESLSATIGTIKKIVASGNTKIKEHNLMVANLGTEKRKLIAQVWRYLLDNEIQGDLKSYQSRKDGINKAIESLENQIKEKEHKRAKKVAHIRELEKDATSIQPTIDAINSLLYSFGFTGFVLAKSEQERYYKIQRPDGSDAKENLSEGERNFITFLYFYHLLKGSDSESGITTDRVVVFDDPVSSLDSDILFVVSSLIKRLFGEVREGAGYIKQIFVLTHNVYFHKEVSYNSNRPQSAAMNEETFWTIKKIDQVSRIQRHDMNPIRTSYELLWNAVRDESHRSKLTIQNSLRRILENYFKILGGIGRDDIIEKFDGEDKVICSSLFSWISDGSHFVNDDLYVASDDSLVEKQLKVFRDIFEKTGHIAHYEMMMGTAGNPSGS